jgi:hypothetical protein
MGRGLHVSRERHHTRGVREVALAALVALPSWVAGAAPVAVSDFPGEGLAGWEARAFEGETDYRLVDDDGERALEGRADASASGLFRTLDVDLDATPRLSWRWWIDAPVRVDDVRTRDGDDFAARVYVVFDGGWAFWRTTTLVYVWGDADAPADDWRNPFTDQARMIALRRGGGGRWHEEARDVRADYRALFGEDPPPVAAVAVMSDTDQSGARARARWAELRFLPPASAPQSTRR